MPDPGFDSRYEGMGNIHKVAAELRIYGKTSDILKITKGRMPFMRIMSTEVAGGPNLAVTDMHIKYKSDYPLQALITCTVESSGGTAENILSFHKNESIMLTEGTRLFAVNHFYNGAVGGAGVFATGTAGVPADITNSQRECLIIRERLGQTGDNISWRVERGYQPSGTNTAAGLSYADGGSSGGGLPTNIVVGDQFLISLVPQAIGDNTGGTYGDNPHNEENFCEISLEKVGVNRTAERIKLYQKETILQRNTVRRVDLFWKKNEIKATFGRKKDGDVQTSPVDGSPIYETGGIDEYIRTAQSAIGYLPYPAGGNADPSGNIINFALGHGAVNYQNLNAFGKNKFYYGSQYKWWIMDDDMYTKISNSFDPKVRINYNQSLSIKYGFKISELEISGGGVFRLVSSDLFFIYGLKNHSFIVDSDYFKSMHLDGEDYMILIDVEKGVNPLKRMDYHYMNRGYLRNCPPAHYIVYNM